MKNNKWILGAMLLGLAFFLAILLVKPVGVSTQFSVASGMIHSIIDPDVIQVDNERESGYRSTNAYYDKDNGKLAKSIKHPLNYDFVFVLSIPLGAVIAKLLNKKKKIQAKKQKEPKQKFNLQEFIKTYSKSFLAGILILFGARLAGGCTSGHMMSGIMQGSVSGLLFTVGVFIVAIPVSYFVFIKGMKKGVSI